MSSWLNSGTDLPDFLFMAMSGSTCTAGGANNTDVYYSTNGGQTWNVSSGATNLAFLALSGTNGIGWRSAGGIFYTTNGGQTFTVSSGQTGNATSESVALVGSTAIFAGTSGIYYSTNGGQTWTISNNTFNSKCVSMASSTHAVAGTNANGIVYTTDGGQTWTQSNLSSGNFVEISYSGNYAIASTQNSGVYYSNDSGVTWSFTTGTTGAYHVGIDSSGRAILSSYLTPRRLYYSTDGGQTITQSNLSTNDDSPMIFSMNQTGGAIASQSGNVGDTYGIYYTTNGGQTWTLSSGTEDCLYTTDLVLSGNGAISGYVSLDITPYLAYSTGPLCFHRDTLVLCDGNVHRPIHELSIGDRVLTHRHGLVPIKHIACAELHNGLYSKPSTFLYRHRASGLQVSGEHRMLVEPDAFPEEAREEQRRQYGLDANLPENQVDGLLMWMACMHPEFERVEEHGTFSMYHLVLEHNNEPMRHYGIFVTEQNLVAETCYEADFYKIRGSYAPPHTPTASPNIVVG